MAKRRGKKRNILGISDKGWDTIGKGFKWWLIAGAIATGVGVLLVGGLFVAGMAFQGAPLGASRQLPPVKIL